MHPEAPANCQGQIVRAHSVRRRADLEAISRKGHVYHGSADYEILRRTGGRIRAALVGINKASTFRGFCSGHDDRTFAPLEKHAFVPTVEQAFLMAYRALSHELYLKRAYVEATKLWQNLDRGRPLEVQIEMQEFVRTVMAASRESETNLLRHKEHFDARLQASDYSSIRYVAFHFDGPPSIVCSNMVQPEYDFRGMRLQDMGILGDDRWDLVSFSIASTESGGVALFSWSEEGDSTAIPLVQSLTSLPDGQQVHALVTYAFEFCGNTFISPDWWESPGPEAREALERRMASGASHAHPRSSRCLIDDGVRVAQWKVTHTTSLW